MEERKEKKPEERREKKLEERREKKPELVVGRMLTVRRASVRSRFITPTKRLQSREVPRPLRQCLQGDSKRTQQRSPRLRSKTPSTRITQRTRLPTSTSPPRKQILLVRTKRIPCFHPYDGRHIDHPVNVTICLINELSMRIFRRTEAYNKDATKAVAKQLNFALPAKFIQDPEQFLQNSLNVIELKYAILQCLYDCLNKHNGVEPHTLPSFGYYNYFVENGSNTSIVDSVMKQRFWVKPTDFVQNADIVWTQWLHNDILKDFPCVHPRTPASQPVPGQEAQSNLQLSLHPKKVYNHIEGGEQLGFKKHLFNNIKEYCTALLKDPFQIIPLTYHVAHGLDDPAIQQFHEHFLIEDEAIRVAKISGRHIGDNIWIVKPGENTNRGFGITTCKTAREVLNAIAKDPGRTYIIQKYVEHPLLVEGRKFDIRCFSLVTAVNGRLKGYFYRDGYIRTSAKAFTLADLADPVVHLTNESIQKYATDFGKYEVGNKLSYGELQERLTRERKNLSLNVVQEIVPQMKQLVAESLRAVHGKMDPDGRTPTFEVFGYDFILDADFRLFLIEANVNSCLVMRSPITTHIIPAMLDNAFRLAVDPLLQPHPAVIAYPGAGLIDFLPEIKYELIYDSVLDVPLVAQATEALATSTDRLPQNAEAYLDEEELVGANRDLRIDEREGLATDRPEYNHEEMRKLTDRYDSHELPSENQGEIPQEQQDSSLDIDVEHPQHQPLLPPESGPQLPNILPAP